MERKKKILSKNRRQHWDTRSSTGRRRISRSNREEAQPCWLLWQSTVNWVQKLPQPNLCECVTRIVSKVSKLISVEEEAAEAQVAERGCGSSWAWHSTWTFGKSLHKAKRKWATVVSCAHCQLCPLSTSVSLSPFLMLQIFTCHAVCVCLLCVCAWKFSTLFAGRRKSKQAARGGESGTGRKGQLAAFALKANCQRHLTKIFSYARAIAGPPSLHRVALLQFSLLFFSFLSTRATCHIPCYLWIWLRFITKSKLHFENLLKEREITFTLTQHRTVPLSFSPSLSPPSLCLSLSHTCKYI